LRVVAVARLIENYLELDPLAGNEKLRGLRISYPELR
jgi:hypothetical protein